MDETFNASLLAYSTNSTDCASLLLCNSNYLSICGDAIVKDCSACSQHSANGVLASFVLVGILIIFGNSLVIASVFFTKKDSRTKYDYAKASLAGANITPGLGLFLLNVPNLVWSLNQTPTALFQYVAESTTLPVSTAACVFFTFFYSSSVYHLLYMAIQRLMAVGWPLYYRKQSFKRVYFYLIIVWCFSVLGTSPVWFQDSIQIYYRPNLFTYLPTFSTRSETEKRSVIFSIIFILIPYLLMILCTIATGLILYTSKKKRKTIRSTQTNRKKANKKSQKENYAFITLFLMYLGFTCSVAPLITSVFLTYFDISQCTNGILQFSLFYFTFVNGFLNASIYSFRDETFRANVKEIFSKIIPNQLKSES